jgi:hypothetical protein
MRGWAIIVLTRLMFRRAVYQRARCGEDPSKDLTVSLLRLFGIGPAGMSGRDILWRRTTSRNLRAPPEFGADVASRTTVKLNKVLCERARIAQQAGYSSTENSSSTYSKKSLRTSEESDSEEDVIKKLKGLGYLE